jgi:hypothetical protein
MTILGARVKARAKATADPPPAVKEDNQRGNYKSKSKDQSRSFAALRMTISGARAKA